MNTNADPKCPSSAARRPRRDATQIGDCAAIPEMNLADPEVIEVSERRRQPHPHDPEAKVDNGDPGPGDDDAPREGGQRERKSQATALVELALSAGLRSWRTPADEPHVTLDDGAHLALGDRRVRGWLRRLWFARGLGALRGQVVADALGTLEGLAYQTDDTYPAHRRIAGDERAIFLHLGYREPVIEVTAEGWRTVAEAPVRFVASAGMLPLPMPVQGGSLDELRALHPALTDESIFALVASFMAGCLRPWGAYAILVLIGEQGSAKSTLARIILRCLDPGEAELRSPPRDTLDLASAVRASRIVALDNVGRIQPWLSDALCIIATGGVFTRRELYTSSDEHLVRAHQPLILTAIDEVITAGDLRDRSLVVRLPPMPDSSRLTDREVADRIEAARPRILGELLDLVSRGLRRHREVGGAHVHRLADHVRWALACEPVDAGRIERAHRAQRSEASAEQLADPIGEALVAIGSAGWSGAMADLLAELEHRVPVDQRGRDWPGSPRGMGSALRRRAPALRRAGIDVEEGSGYGPRRRDRGVTMKVRRNVGTSAEGGYLVETVGDDGADVPADVGAGSDSMSARRRHKKPSNSNAADVADVADVPPEPPEREVGWL